MNNTINLSGGWATLWSALNIPPGLTVVLTVVGVIIVVFAIIKWIIDRKRMGNSNMGQSSTPLMWAMIAGAALAAPNIIIPIALTFLDWIINGLVSLWNGTGGGK